MLTKPLSLICSQVSFICTSWRWTWYPSRYQTVWHLFPAGCYCHTGMPAILACSFGVWFVFFGFFLQSCVVFYQLSAVLNFSLARTCPRRMWYLCKFLSLTWLWNATRTVLIMLIRCWRQLWKYSTNLIWNSKLMSLTFSLERQWILSNPLHGTTYSKIAKRHSLDVWNYCFWAKQWGIMIN